MSGLPRSRIIKVEFEFALPTAATLKEIDEWVQFNLESGGMREDSRLIDCPLEIIEPATLTDTGRHLDRQLLDAEKLPNGGTRYRVRTRRTLGPIPDDQPLDPVREHSLDAFAPDLGER